MRYRWVSNGRGVSQRDSRPEASEPPSPVFALRPRWEQQRLSLAVFNHRTGDHRRRGGLWHPGPIREEGEAQP